MIKFKRDSFLIRSDLGSPGWDPLYGWGRINAGRALQEAGVLLPPSTDPVNIDTTPPRVSILKPLNETRITGITFISIVTSDNTQLHKSLVYKDDSLFNKMFNTPTNLNPKNFYWNTSQDSDGWHKIVASNRQVK